MVGSVLTLSYISNPKQCRKQSLLLGLTDLPTQEAWLRKLWSGKARGRAFFNFRVQFRVLDCNRLSLMSVGHTMLGCRTKEACEVSSLEKLASIQAR